MTKYLVVHEEPHVGITIVPEGAIVPYATTEWAIKSGKQIQFVYMRMHKLLDKYHLGGSYDSFARYALDYDELCALIEEHMGPSDEARLEEALEESRRLLEWRPSRVDLLPLASLVPIALGAAVRIFGHALKFLIIMVVTPFALSRFGRRNK